ncbi:hypothetical protein BKA83DRAFT_4127767 [Pisolithus microcarpus]|nr:hypothetical protein BKA83DRAFT_4127767 [Pisolithus microcarpus]
MGIPTPIENLQLPQLLNWRITMENPPSAQLGIPHPHKRGGEIPVWQLGNLHTHGESPSVQLEIPHPPIKGGEKSHSSSWEISPPMENLQLPDWRIPTPHRRHGEIPPWELGNLHTHGEIPHRHLENLHTHGEIPHWHLENLHSQGESTLVQLEICHSPQKKGGEIPFWQLGNLHIHGESPAA